MTSHTSRARVRFYAELNDFLKADDRFRVIPVPFTAGPSVKDLIEGKNVPHTEVDLVVVNGHSVDFTYRVRNDDFVSVFPVFETFDISSVTKLRSDPLREPRFLVDVNLGQLARYLRLIGFDSTLSDELTDAQLAEKSARDHRILLSRDVGVFKHAVITHGYFVRGVDPYEQLRETVEHFDLYGAMAPFTRCMECNGRLNALSPAEVGDRVPEGVRARFDRFTGCPDCGRIYWQGSHFRNMNRVIDDLRRGHNERREGTG